MQNKPIAKAIIAALRFVAWMQLAGVTACLAEWFIYDLFIDNAEPFVLKRVPGYLGWIGGSYLGDWFGATALFELVTLSVALLIGCRVYVRASDQLERTLEQQRLSENMTRKDIDRGDDSSVPARPPIGGYSPYFGAQPWQPSQPVSLGGSYEITEEDPDDQVDNTDGPNAIRDDEETRDRDNPPHNGGDVREFPRNQQGRRPDDID